MIRSILIADDEESTRSVLRETFERKGYRVNIAADGREALDVIHSRHVTLGIFDYQMPRLDGINLLQELRGSNCMIPVLILSSEMDASLREMAFAAGADGFFKKPVDVRGLRAEVSRLIGEETSLTVHGMTMNITVRIKK